MDVPVPRNEPERYTAVQSYRVYGSDPVAALDDLAELAVQLAEVPISLVNSVCDRSVWIKARHGVPPDLSKVPRGALCCAHTIYELVVTDTHADDRLRDMKAHKPTFSEFGGRACGVPTLDSRRMGGVF